jgi:eukaryotic-like serine/threonine-protein kinase
MVQRNDDPQPIDRDLAPEADDEDDRLGEAIEEYLALAERGQAPQLEAFLAKHDDLKDDLRAALEGLELVHGLVGQASGSSLNSMHGGGSARWLESGHRIAGYRVVRELGRGGMGTVYEAVHVGLDRPVALKVLGTHAAPDSSARRRFLNEAKTAAGLHHTHIVPVFDVGQVAGLCYYAMQRIEGSGLDRVVRHLRRSRPAGVGPAGSSSLADAAAVASSFGSRFGHIWHRVSPGWLWRHPWPVSTVTRAAAPVANGGPDCTQPPAVQARLGQEGLALLPPMPTGDSTASWASRRSELRDRRESLPATRDHGAERSGSMIGLAGSPVKKSSGRDDEPPPFEPPRGSAYFRWVASVGFQAADALAHAHHQGVIHRDVKPSNLLIDAKGSIWVTDFGLARRLADPGLTHHDSLLGTPRYMSPEQARTAGKIDGRTDVYSLGATLYELLTLRPPFDGQSAAELVDQIGRDDPIPPRHLEPRVPRDLETIVLKALAKRPVDRYATAAELAEDLARFLSHAPVKARRIGPVGRLWRVARRHPWSAAVTTAAAALIVAITTYSYVRILANQAEVSAANEALKLALDEAKAANRESQAAQRAQILKTAQMLEATDKPDRRGQGLDLISEAVKLRLSNNERGEFRDEAVKFLVLRDVLTRQPLSTGPGMGLTFGPQGHRIWVLSADNDTLSLWDPEQGRALMRLPLRGGPSPVAGEADPAAAGAEPGAGQVAGASTVDGRPRPRNVVPTNSFRSFGRSVAMAGNYLAVLLPEESGVTLIDAMTGTPLRKLTSPGHSIIGVIADATGHRLVTIEQTQDSSPSTDEKGPTADGEAPAPRWEYQVNLWDMDHLDEPPITVDPWQRPPQGHGARDGSFSRPPQGRAPDWPPLVAVSPDGKTIAIAPPNNPFDTSVRLFSVQDGEPRRRPINNQTEVSALALGPNGMMAVAGRGQVRLYDIDNGGAAYVTSFQTDSASFTWLMRFSPLGMLAMARRGGPIEIWDPAAQTRVAELPGSEQAFDLAFSPDGRTLAAVGRTETMSVWIIQDSAMRTQLSGFDARPTSLAFGPDGILAGAGLDGGVWISRNGRCPESGPTMPLAAVHDGDPSAGRTGPAARGPGSGPGPGSSPALSQVVQSGPAPQPPRGGPGFGGRQRDGGRGGPRGGGPAGPVHNEDRPTSLAFDAQGRLVVHELAGVRIWPAGSILEQPASAFHRLPDMPQTGFRMPRISRTDDGRIMALLRQTSVYLWRAEAPDRLVPVIPPPRSRTTAPTTATSPAGSSARTKASGGDPSQPFRTVQLAPGGHRIYLIDLTGHLHVWDIDGSPGDAELHAAERIPAFPPLDPLSNLALRPDGAILAAGDRSGTVTLIDTARASVVASIKPSGDESETFYRYIALAFSPDGRTLAVGSAQQGTISLYSLDPPRSPQLRLRLPGHHGLVANLVFDATGTRLATTAGNDPIVEVWDIDLIKRELVGMGLGTNLR